MTRYGVYHLSQDLLEEDPDLYENLNFGDFEGSFLEIREHLDFIATVEDVESPEEVFEATQNRDENWSNESKVTDLQDESPRSSMVGDVFVSIKGDAYMVDIDGFNRI